MISTEMQSESKIFCKINTNQYICNKGSECSSRKQYKDLCIYKALHGKVNITDLNLKFLKWWDLRGGSVQ